MPDLPEGSWYKGQASDQKPVAVPTMSIFSPLTALARPGSGNHVPAPTPRELYRALARSIPQH